METASMLIALVPLVLAACLVVWCARSITEGRGFKAVRETVPAVIVLLIAIVVINGVSSAGGGGGGDDGGDDDGGDPEDQVDVPADMMIFEIRSPERKSAEGAYAVLVGISDEYEVPDGGYRLVVPTTHQGHAVDAIGSGDEPDWDAVDAGTYLNPFEGCASVSSESVTMLNDYAFSMCTSLASASFPAATTIGEEAFADCTSLASASFPAATDIGFGAFTYCTSLASASFPAATTIGNEAFYGCTSLASASFPAATTIGDYAFQMLANVGAVSAIEAVTLGPLVSVGEHAFVDWTFYDADGTTVLDKTAANLANCTFEGTASALIKQPSDTLRKAVVA